MKQLFYLFLICIGVSTSLQELAAQSTIRPNNNRPTNNRTEQPRTNRSTTGNNTSRTSTNNRNGSKPTIPSKKPTARVSTGPNGMQDLTSRYNRYFNAKLQYDQGILSLSQDQEDNYEEILPIYTANGGDGSQISSNLDAAIKKASLAIRMKPNSKWVDDCYLLLGQCHYLKGDYDEAVKSFQYVGNKFGESVRIASDPKTKEQLKKQQAKDREKAKEALLKERETLEKEREAERKEKEQAKVDAKKEREQDKKDTTKEREKDKKETAKERETVQKEREEAKQATAKDRAATKKAKDKARKEAAKVKAKDKKLRDKEKTRKAKFRAKEKARKAKARKKKQSYEARVYVPKYVPSDASAEEIAAAEAEKEAELAKIAAEKEEREAKAVAEKEERAKTKEAKENKELEKAAEDEAKELEKAEKEAAKKTKEADKKKNKSPKEGEVKDYTYNEGGLSFLKHKPAKNDAKLWLARSYVAKEMYSEALAIMSEMEASRTLPKKLRGELATLKAYYHLEQEDIPAAKLAISEATSGLKKADRARLYYILGQLANEQGNYDEAVTAFQRVTKSKPLYDMEFNARLNIAKTKLLSGDYSNQQAIAYLEKMAKDGKNIDYQDQIYFAMAEVAIASGDMDMATEYLAQSAANSTANPEQKALSFLKLAEISYSVGDFIQAAGYYDSTLTSLPKNYKGYDEIVDRKEVLTELATHAQTVTLEDSLQNLAKMTAGKRTVYIEEIIAQLEAEAQKLRLEKEEAFLQDPNANKKDKKQSGDWYFYNPTAKALGFSEFQSRWGSRPLTDDWRLNSKISGTSGGGSDLAEENGAAEGALAAGESISRDELLNRADQGTLTVQDFLKDLPLTAEKMMTSDQKVISALYQMAMIYRTRLESEDKAETIFKDILQRYPKNAEYGPQVNYNLYLMADKANDSALRSRYRNAILQQFPESLFAKILKDESYINKANEADEELWAYYEQTYDLYKGGDFDQVQARFQELNTKFERNPLQAKFDLLGALVIGETQDKNAYITALKAVIKAHNKGEERDKAKEILDYIEGKSKKGKSSDSKYTYDPNKKHYIVVALDQYTKNISKITNQFSDFNNGNFSAEKLKTNQMLLDPKHQIILVKDFKNATAAMNYYKALEKNEVSVMKGLQTGYKFFAISKSNFTQYFKEKDPTSYIEFFEENYK